MIILYYDLIYSMLAKMMCTKPEAALFSESIQNLARYVDLLQ